MQAVDTHELIPVKEVLRLTGLSRMALSRRVRQGKLTIRPLHPSYQKHGSAGIPRVQVLALLSPEAR